MMNTTPKEQRGHLWRSRWAAIGAAVAVTLGGGGLFAVNAASPESSVVTIDPVRILDTRDPTNVGLAGPFISPAPQDLKVTGSIPTTTGTKEVVPAGATGVFLNVTPVGSTAAGFISVRPANAAGLPSTSNVNFTVGAINPNGVLVELPVGGIDDGKIEITFDAYGSNGQTSDILVDVVGYTTDSRLKALETKVDALVPPLFATINSNGTVRNGIASGLIASTREGTGQYLLTFNRPVENCVPVTSDWAFSATRDVSADAAVGPGDNTVRLWVTNEADALEDTTFNIVVQCPPLGAAPLTMEDSEPNPNE